MTWNLYTDLSWKICEKLTFIKIWSKRRITNQEGSKAQVKKQRNWIFWKHNRKYSLKFFKIFLFSYYSLIHSSVKMNTRQNWRSLILFSIFYLEKNIYLFSNLFWVRIKKFIFIFKFMLFILFGLRKNDLLILFYFILFYLALEFFLLILFYFIWT